jgi:deazaflavin-dependent oxidoreductase (nitroreductase family)
MSTGTPSLRHPQRVPLFVRAPGPIVRRLLSRGLPFGPNVLLTVRGRKSGELHTFPVALVEHDGRRYVQSPFGEVNWVHNLRAAGEAVITKGERRETLDARALDPNEAAPVLRAVLRPYLTNPLIGPLTRRYFGIQPDASDEAWAEKARRQPIFELTARG